jgi:hypothetical protein
VSLDATFHGDSSDTIDGRVRLWRLEISPFNFLLFLAAPHLQGVLVLVTGNNFGAGVVVTGDSCSPVSLSPAINLSPVSLSLAIIVKFIVLKIRDKDYSPVSMTPAINLSPMSLTPVNSLSHLFANISANF